jgi:membrane associated rhomboid family serine protease
MPPARYPYRTRSAFYGYLPNGIKWLLISNTAVFLISTLSGPGFQSNVMTLFALYAEAWRSFPPYVWQIFTYMFLHGGPWHLIFNMLALWMFGKQIEQDWGTRPFLKYYFLCGMAAGVCVLLVNAAMGKWTLLTIGASGGIFGVLLAFGVLYPDQTVLMSFLFPIKAKYFVMIYAAVELYVTVTSTPSGVSTIAHLGGMAFGWVYLKTRRPKWKLPDWGGAYRQWKMQRAKKKFQVYMRKHGNGPWVN